MTLNSVVLQVRQLIIAHRHKVLKIAKTKSKSQRKRYIEQARKYLSKKVPEAVVPPPSWKTVLPKNRLEFALPGRMNANAMLADLRGRNLVSINKSEIK